MIPLWFFTLRYFGHIPHTVLTTEPAGQSKLVANDSLLSSAASSLLLVAVFGPHIFWSLCTGDCVPLFQSINALQVNAPDDNGVLVGNWSGDYEGGTSPLEWTGSVAILEEYYRTKKPVSYGQCWVFSGLVTTGELCMKTKQHRTQTDSDSRRISVSEQTTKLLSRFFRRWSHPHMN